MDRQHISVRDVLKTIREDEIEFVDMKFVDLFGGLQHITFPAKALDEGSFARGVNFDGSSVRGFQAISESDLLLKPDTSSLFRDPFFDDPTISTFREYSEDDESAASLMQNDRAPKDVDGAEHRVVSMCDEFLPLVTRTHHHGCLYEAKVGPGVVDPNEQGSLAMLDVILDTLGAGEHDARL